MNSLPGKIDVLLVNTLFRRPFGVREMNVPLGLEYMKSALGKNGFHAEICNLDYSDDWQEQQFDTSTGRDWAINERVLDETKRKVEDSTQKWWAEYRRLLEVMKPSIVGVGIVTPQYHAAAMTAKITRETLPEAKVIAGGVHCTVMPEDVLDTGLFDAVAISEGENTVVELAKRYVSGNGNIDDVDGIAFKREGEFVKTQTVTLIDDLDTLEFPARECIVPPGRRAQTAGYSATIITSRGCPFKCTFCARPALWMHNRVRYRSVENVIEELHFLKKKYDTCYFYLLDDTFNIIKDRVEEFCGQLMKSRLGMKWYAYLRVDRIDEEQVRLMKRAGMDSVYIGCESGSQELIDKMQRGITLDHVRRGVEILKRNKIFINCSFIAGHPDETEKTLQSTIDIFDELKASNNIIYFMVPYPGTKIFDDLKEQDKIITYDWFHYNMYNPSLIKRDNVTDGQLVDAVKTLYRKNFENRKKDWSRILDPTFIWSKVKTIKSPARFFELAGRLLSKLRGNQL